MESKNLTIMLTDIQGFTDTSAVSSRDEIIALIRRHNKLMEPIIKFYNGTIIKSIGDALLCSFLSATDGVVCAIMIQKLLEKFNSNQEDKSRIMNIRIVLNSGDVCIEDKDIFGEAVNVTARMEGLPCFPGGSIGISSSTYLLMNRNEIKADLIGEKELKGIPEPVKVYIVPLDKQKTKEIPVKLVTIMDKIISGKSAINSSDIFNALGEYSNSMQTLIKDSKISENIGNISKNISTRAINLKKEIKNKTRFPIIKKESLIKAGIPNRMTSFGIDFVIILLFTLLLNLGWWLTSPMIFENDKKDEKINKETIKEWKKYKASRRKSATKEKLKTLEDFSKKEKGFIENFIDFNVKFPVLIIFLYFIIMWKIKNATAGQLITGLHVTMDDNSEMDFITIVKRSGILTLSTCLLGIGVIFIFFGKKKCLHDLICETQIIENS